jgi:hypothetical protein
MGVRGMATCESCTLPLVNKALIGTCPSATSRWSFVPAPVWFVPLAIHLGANVALLRQIGDHAIQFLVPLDARAPLPGLHPFDGRFGAFTLALLGLPLLLPVRLLLWRRLRKSLPSLYRRRVLRNVPDQTFPLGVSMTAACM